MSDRERQLLRRARAKAARLPASRRDGLVNTKPRDEHELIIDRFLASQGTGRRADEVGAPTSTVEVIGPDGPVTVRAWIAARLSQAEQLGIKPSGGSGSTTITGPDGSPTTVPQWIARTLAELDRENSREDSIERGFKRRAGYSVDAPDVDEDEIVARYLVSQGYR